MSLARLLQLANTSHAHVVFVALPPPLDAAPDPAGLACNPLYKPPYKPLLALSEPLGLGGGKSPNKFILAVVVSRSAGGVKWYVRPHEIIRSNAKPPSNFKPQSLSWTSLSNRQKIKW